MPITNQKHDVSCLHKICLCRSDDCGRNHWSIKIAHEIENTLINSIARNLICSCFGCSVKVLFESKSVSKSDTTGRHRVVSQTLWAIIF